MKYGKKIMIIILCGVCAALIAAGIVFGVMRSRTRNVTQLTETSMPEKDKKEVRERPKEPADEAEPEPEIRDYAVDYREAYQEIVRQSVNGERGASEYCVHDMDGDGIPELFVLEGTFNAALRWMAYSYDIEEGSAYSLGEVAIGTTMLYEPENREAGIIAVRGYMGVEWVYSVKKAGKTGLTITAIAESREVPGDYYSTPYELYTWEADDPSGLDFIMGETLSFDTGLKTPEGRNIYKFTGEAYATSVLQEPDRKHSTEHLSDLDPSTVWAEGTEGTGEGEAVVISTGLPYHADGMAILPGYCRDKETYEKNGRPVKVTVKCGDVVVSEELKEFRPDFSHPLNSMIYIDFDETVYTDKFTVFINQAVEGTQYEDMCIAELFPYSYSAESGYSN